MALLVLPIAALVALAAMLIGATARIYDQRESLIAFIRSDTQAILVAAQRRELLLPTLILGGGAALAGLDCGSTLGVVNPHYPHSIDIFPDLLALALLLADRIARPLLARVSTSLSER